MDPLSIAKSADSKSNHIVIGYIHEIESQLNFPEITSLIIHMILGFYYQNEFIAKYREDCFEVSEDKLTITNTKFIGFLAHSIYFNQWIESTSHIIVKWTFKMNKVIEEGTKFYFGLVSKETDTLSDFCSASDEYTPNYAVCGDGQLWNDGRWVGNSDTLTELMEDDLVTFILDLSVGKFKCSIQDRVEETELFAVSIGLSDPIRYKFALQMGTKGNSVILTNFEIIEF